jgi:hypothetical protein
MDTHEELTKNSLTVLRDSDLRMTALAKTAEIVNDRPVLSSERVPHFNKPAVI